MCVAEVNYLLVTPVFFFLPVIGQNVNFRRDLLFLSILRDPEIMYVEKRTDN